MNAQHFKELLGTVMMTKNVTQEKVAEALGVTGRTMVYWKQVGVPAKRMSRIRPKLHAFMKEA